MLARGASVVAAGHIGKRLTPFDEVFTDSPFIFFFSSRRRHTRSDRDWSSDVCSSDLDRDEYRASFGTQKMLAARYSSRSSGSAPCFFCASSSACLASNASEMYLRKIKPRDRKSVV